MKRIGLVLKPDNPGAIKFANELSAWVVEKGGRVYSGKDAAQIPASVAVPHDELPEHIDILVVLGGDGTMLSAARLLDGKKIPILGVNLGGLGFLTAITVKEVYPLLERILKDDFKTEERMMLSVELLRGDKTVISRKVLNDVIVRGGLARLVRLEARINKEYVNTYRADGLIVATPTGSTAYSLSAAGPILYPTIHSIIVAPICPFNLTNRPVVIPDWMTVDVTVAPGQTNIQLVLDGQAGIALESADVVKIGRADASVYLIRYEGKSYFDILRERLMWEMKGDSK